MNGWSTQTQAGEVPSLSIVDPREENDEFQRLPESAKRDLRTAWHKQDQEAIWAEKRRKGYLYQSMVEGMGLLIVIEEWRFDAIDPVTTPHLWKLAERGQRFHRHFSTGNSSRYGIFGLMYGLHKGRQSANSSRIAPL